MRQADAKQKTKEIGIPLLTETGKNLLAMQASLAKDFKYAPLPEDVRMQAHSKYISTLPTGFKVTKEYSNLASDIRGMASPTNVGGSYKPGYEIYPEKTFPLYSREGTLIAKKFDRIVIGDYGAFIEIGQEDMLMGNVKVKEGQEYRIEDEKYSKHVKYQWFTTKDDSNCKLYFQQKGVTYADYMPGKWYISPYEVLNKDELEHFAIQNELKIDVKNNNASNSLLFTPPSALDETQFLPKPPGYKTENQWRKEGMCPKDGSVFEEYAAVKANGEMWLDENGKPNLYRYISPENVVPIEQKNTADILNLDGKNIICFDTETTGFSKWDEIIQITISNGKGEELLNTFVKPVNKKSWKEASEVNHIYPEDVKDAPTAKDLKTQIRTLFEKADVLVGHNISFDIRMVEQCFHISLRGKPIFDTLDYFRKNVPEVSHKLANAVEHYCPEIMEKFEAGAHKSDTDVWATVAVFNRIVEQEKEKIGNRLQTEEEEEERAR